ncbi:MAG: hypothetical protein ACE5IR_25655 [bacterium]
MNKIKKITKFVIGVSLLVLLIVLFRSKNEVNTSDKNPLSKANSKQEAVAKGSASSSPPPPPKLKAWYSGGTLHGAKMSEWSRSPYANRLATSADFVTKMMQMDGMTIPPVNQIRPMAEKLEGNISAANKDGIANSQDVATVAATCWVLMKQ